MNDILTRPEQVGFTGTRRGMNDYQRINLRRFFSLLERNYNTKCHHGNCIGADEEFNRIALTFGFWTIAHRPDNPTLESRIQSCEVRDPLPYLVRNKVIVRSSQVMVIAPLEMEEQQRGGTWSTYRYTKELNVPYLLLLPEPSEEPDESTFVY